VSSRIAFQFDDNLQFQQDAIKSVVNLFKGVSRQAGSTIYPSVSRIRKIGEGDPIRNPSIIQETRLLQNLREVQSINRLLPDRELAGGNFTIEMETGTGKTYVYLRTILELYKTYGFIKFMIVVPSIAIRKGVEKSIEMLRDHFKALYDGLDLVKHSFVYDSNNLDKISTSFVETRDLSIVIMNIQAFNKDTNKIRQSDEYGQVIWEDIKYINPIIIIDEPQKLEGSTKRKSSSLEAIEMLEPLFILRYSATHKRFFNQIYKLDSYDAYKNSLVKKIEVKTVHGTVPKDFPYIRYLEFTKDLYARIEIFAVEQGGIIRPQQFKVRGGDSLYECSGRLEQYRNMIVQEDPHKLKKLKIGDWDEILELGVGETNVSLDSEEIIRIQVRLAIKSHLEKQYSILKKGHYIKVLSLFFVDEVSKVRDSNVVDGRGEYLRIFDEEYAKIIRDSRWNKVFKEYPELFEQYEDIQKVREGYFAVDKNKNPVEIENWGSIMDEEKLKAKAQQDIDRGIELILEKKDELISFSEPLAFIFSHSALREGWDNPNVFTLCTLKKSGSDIAKKQEIGRGLRLPVDINGNRSVDDEINVLTVIANDSYDNFAAALQKDFNEQSGFNKDAVTFDVIYNTLKEAGLPEAKLMEAGEVFRIELLKAGIIGKDGILTKAAKEIHHISFNDVTLQEHSIMIKEKFVAAMWAKGTKKIPIINGDADPVENGKHSYVSEEYFQKLLQELGNRLSKRTMYQVQLDTAAFINECVADLNEKLRFKGIRNEYLIETGKGDFDNAGQFRMSDVAAWKLHDEISEIQPGKTDFDIINYIMYHTTLPRLAIYRIISKLEKKYLLQNQDILDEVTKEIRAKLTRNISNNDLRYEVIEGYEFGESTIFAFQQIDRSMLDDAASLVFATDANKRKALHRYYKFDSQAELEFARRLESDDDVLLYSKFKKGGFVIDTPYGEYTPDWAIIRHRAGEQVKLFFIVETKGSKEGDDLFGKENVKIKCGTLHFKAVADDVEFHWAKDYDDFLCKIPS
jgi:type III restriction enzyme